jgi:heme iron utilization protein
MFFMPDKKNTVPVEIIKHVVNTQYFAVLGSVEEAQPYSNLIAFAATEDLKYLIFVTSRNTRKYRNMTMNHRVSLLIDNRMNQAGDVNQATAITIIGSVHEDTARESEFKSIFLRRHPHLSQFIEAPESAVMVVAVSEYIVAGFTQTQRLVID